MKVGDLLLKYETDKNRGKILPKEGHYYGDSYDRIFENFDKDSSINILEIGVQKGGSLLAWKDYFKNSYVVGVDIVDVRLDEYKRSDVNFILSDVRDPFLKVTLNDRMYDIIIDDGSHYLQDVVYVVDNFLNKLNMNGYMIIEDVQHSNQWVSTISSMVDQSKYQITCDDLRGVNGHYDDFLIVIKRIG